MNVLITGASTGIGEACARWLVAKGHRVFAGVRRNEDANRLTAGMSDHMTPVILDVADDASITEALKRVSNAVEAEGLHGIVNNAGIAVAGPLEYLTIESFRRQLDVNVTGQVAVTQAALPLLRTAKGRIVFMGSIGGRMATPFLGPYCASKFALEAIADAMRVELQPWGLHVSIVEPGSIATPIWTKPAVDERMPADRAHRLQRDYGTALAAFTQAAADAARRGIPPDVVAAAVEHALTSPSPKTRYVIGRDARAQAIVRRVIPDRWLDRLITRALKLPPRQ